MDNIPKFKTCSRICAVKFCPNSTPYLEKNTSLFSFPKDAKRCKQWVEACECEHLLRFVNNLNGSEYYKVCSIHFSNEMFSKKSTKTARLTADAMPVLNLPKTEFLAVDVLQCTTSERSAPVLRYPQNQNVVEANVALISSSPQSVVNFPQNENVVETNVALPSSSALPIVNFPQNESVAETNVALPSTPDPCHSSTTNIFRPSLELKSKNTQTTSALSSNTPQIRKLKSSVHSLRRKCRLLEKHKYKTEHLESIKSSATLEDFKSLCDTFLPKECAHFVKQQAELHNKRPHQRKYTEEFLYTCLKLYFMSPKAYQGISEIFTLPTKRTLNRITENIQFKPGFTNSNFLKLLKER